MPGQAYAVFVRTPHAHARIKTIDTAAAKKMPGVIAVLTGADYIADGLKGRLQRANPAGAIDIKVRAFDPAKRPVLEEQQYPLVADRVRYPGEAVAMVVAESRLAARDAAEAVEVEYDVLPAVTDVREAQGAEPIWPGPCPDNVALDESFGDGAAVRAAFERGRSRGRADLRQSAHRQLPDGAALGRRLLRRGDGFLHADLGQPGRPRAAHGAGGELGLPLGTGSGSSAPTSAAASGCATISIPSRRRSCGRRSASAAR